MASREKLGGFLNEVINWNWEEFCLAENDAQYKGYQSTVFALVRSCAEAKLGAIKLAIDRIDGKVETPVDIVYPKIYFLYPYAKSVEGGEPVKELSTSKELTVATPPEPETPEPEVIDTEEKLATATLRETLHAMMDAPRAVVPLIRERKALVEKILKDDSKIDFEPPKVKSVVAANLIHLAVDKNKFEAITEIFDQIDGKLVETIRVLGDDVYITQYASIAPEGAYINGDGVYTLENKAISAVWEDKLRTNTKAKK